MVAIIDTDRLQIRELSTLSDLPFILELFNDPSFIRFVGDRGLRTLDDSHRYVEEQAASYHRNGFGLWAVDLKSDAIPVGICGLLRRPPLTDVEIGFGFLERFCRKGYASEAAGAVMSFGRQRLGLKRIVAVTAPDNDGSIRILEKLGLQFETLIDLPGYEERRKLFTPVL